MFIVTPSNDSVLVLDSAEKNKYSFDLSAYLICPLCEHLLCNDPEVSGVEQHYIAEKQVNGEWSTSDLIEVKYTFGPYPQQTWEIKSEAESVSQHRIYMMNYFKLSSAHRFIQEFDLCIEPSPCIAAWNKEELALEVTFESYLERAKTFKFDLASDFEIESCPIKTIGLNSTEIIAVPVVTYKEPELSLVFDLSQ